MKQHDIATELDRAFAAATRHALMNGVKISDKVDPLYAIHKALNATHASGELTDEQYSRKGPRTSLDGRLAQKCAVPQNYGLKSQDRAGAVVL